MKKGSYFLTSTAAVCLCVLCCVTAQAQTEWTTDWTAWVPAPGGDTTRVTVDTTGTELIVYYNGSGNSFDGWGPQVEATGLSPVIPAANQWARIEVTLTGWETALAGYNFANEDGWFGGDAGRQTGDVNCVFRFNGSLLRFHLDPTATTRQILVIDMVELSNNSWGGDAWGTADVTQLNFEMPWNGNDKVMAQWAAANTTMQYLGFFATKAEAVAAGNGASPTRIVEFVDATAPVISLIGDAVVNLYLGESWTDPGVTASDDIDGDITANVVVGGDTVDVNTEGTYVITYNVSDAAGNPATEVTRTVNVAADSDGDGLSDSWEMTYFGDLSQGPNDDPDGDGATNAEEFAAGTSPIDPTSKLPAQSIATLVLLSAMLAWGYRLRCRRQHQSS